MKTPTDLHVQGGLIVDGNIKYKTGTSGVWSIGQITINGEGIVTNIRSVNNTDFFRELINKVIDEREEIKKLQEEVSVLNQRIVVKSIMCNPNKYKVSNGTSK